MAEDESQPEEPQPEETEPQPKAEIEQDDASVSEPAETPPAEAPPAESLSAVLTESGDEKGDEKEISVSTTKAGRTSRQKSFSSQSKSPRSSKITSPKSSHEQKHSPRHSSQGSKGSSPKGSLPGSIHGSKGSRRSIISSNSKKEGKKQDGKRVSKSAPVARETSPSAESTGIESKETESLTCPSESELQRRGSPINPYNRFKFPNILPQWPLPDREDQKPDVVNSVPSLEGGLFPQSFMDMCCCRPGDSPNTCSCCPTTIRDDEGCCRSEWARKEFYFHTKARVEKAVKKHKIFLLRGELPKLQEALEERGWIQKYEATKTRTVPYGSVASLDTKSLGDIRQEDGTLNEKALIFHMLRHRVPDFIWDCRNDFIDWDCTLRSDTLLNRYQKSFIYTSKLGMEHLLQQDAHWLYEDQISSVQCPRSYNLSRDLNAFIQDYRYTAAMSLLKWFVTQVQEGQDIINRGKDPIPMSQIGFAINRCEETVVSKLNQNLDTDTPTIIINEWDLFLEDYMSVIHKGNGIAEPKDGAQVQLEKYYLAAQSVLKKVKEVDPQYDLSGMRNIWILKPSDLCCGTGISISHNLKEIFQRVNSKPKDYFVVQKYIERPLFVQETKFDIRQWYLVTNTFPLTIWMFKEALLRFSSRPYTFATYHEAIHICNTAIQEKYDEEKRRRKKRKNSDEIEESVRDHDWDCVKLNEYLKNVGYKGEPYYEEVYPKMTQAIILTMLASQEYMDKRRCSFELYGADFMVMADLSVWLIEINTNPRMHPPSQKITERLYPAVLESVVKVIMDLPTNPCASTGGFVLAYKQNIYEFHPYLGPCLFVFGKAMSIHETANKREKEERAKICSPWGKQHRAWTAPPMMPRLRDPKIVDLIDYLNATRCPSH